MPILGSVERVRGGVEEVAHVYDAEAANPGGVSGFGERDVESVVEPEWFSE